MNAAITFSRQMGITHAEFYRLLPVALGECKYARMDNGVTIDDEQGQLMIQLGPQAERVIGSMRVPVTCMTFSFSGYTPSQVEAFMGRFERSFQRGGG